MPTKKDKIIYWAPRIISILFLCFLAMFSLDVFTPEASAGEIAVGLFMHNLPVIVLAAVLAISWKREIIAGVVFILAGLLYIAMLAAGAFREKFEWYMLSWALLVAGPAFLVGALFIVNWRRRKADRAAARPLDVL